LQKEIKGWGARWRGNGNLEKKLSIQVRGCSNLVHSPLNESRRDDERGDSTCGEKRAGRQNETLFPALKRGYGTIAGKNPT
jgi:hypothetical protein